VIGVTEDDDVDENSFRVPGLGEGVASSAPYMKSRTTRGGSGGTGAVGSAPMIVVTAATVAAVMGSVMLELRLFLVVLLPPQMLSPEDKSPSPSASLKSNIAAEKGKY
jgi:hypothetical protein